MNIKSVFNKDTLLIAGGAVGSSIASNLIIGRFGRFLPGIMSPFGRAAYNVALPIAVAMLLTRFRLSPNLAKGMVIGGVANGLGQLLTATRVLPAGTVVNAAPAAPALPAAPATSATGEYLGEYLGGGMDALGAAFATDAWS
jgi:hypothetical protein